MNMQKLLFEVSLLDKMSKPAGKMMKNMDAVTHKIQRGFTQMGVGAAGLAGAGFALEKIIGPAKEMHSALGEVASLDVGQDVLHNLNKTALQFSVKYGESASDFVAASYDIQSAINGLVGNELAAFTNASAVLAKGTKSDTGTITQFVGTMYGIFKKNADAMGKADWVKQLAGQTATAVQMFKTTGSEMSAAFGSVGANGQSMGIAMNEQIAILGTLQATMSGAEAGTKYKSFLAGVGKAQDALGLKFTDQQGKMLPMVDILNKIKGKYGEIDTVAESDALQKAFGRKEAVDLIKLLSTNVDGLSSSIHQVGQQTGIDKAVQMAGTITNPWDRASRAVEALTVLLGQQMLPVLSPLFDGITRVSGKLMQWSDRFPTISKYLGVAVLGVIGITAAFAAFSVAAGIGTFLATGFGIAMSVITSPITLIVAGIAALAFGLYQLEKNFGIIDRMTAGFDFLKNKAIALKDFFNNFNLLDFLMRQIDWLISKINLIPGVNIDMGSAPTPIPAPAAINTQSSAPKGGLMQQFSTMNEKTSHMGGITVNNFGQPMNGQTLASEIAFAGG